MESNSWITALHELGTIIAATAAAIAAVSSLKNGRTLSDKVDPKLEDVRQVIAKPPKKKTPNAGSGDWYKPPDLG